MPLLVRDTTMTISKELTMKIHRFIIQTLFLLFLWLGVGIQAQAQTGTVTYIYTDQQGTPLAEANASGTITATFDYTPYGSLALGTAPNGPGYTGHVNDPDTGLVYMQARYYDPATGRFLSVDPVGPTAGNAFNFSRYSYGNNNPIFNIDPNGRQATGVDMVTIYDNKGQAMLVPSSVAAQATMAVRTSSNVSDYTSPSIDTVSAAKAADNVQLGATGVMVATSVDAPPVSAVAGIASEVMGFAAFGLDPTLERAANVLTIGMFSGLKQLTKEVPQAYKMVETVEKADSAYELNKGAQQLSSQQQPPTTSPNQTPPLKQATPPPPPPPPPQQDQ